MQIAERKKIRYLISGIPPLDGCYKICLLKFKVFKHFAPHRCCVLLQRLNTDDVLMHNTFVSNFLTTFQRKKNIHSMTMVNGITVQKTLLPKTRGNDLHYSALATLIKEKCSRFVASRETGSGILDLEFDSVARLSFDF